MIVDVDPLYPSYDPLSVNVNIAVKSGTLKQVYYADSNTYAPNRMLTPLYLQPSVYTVDPNKIIADGDKIAQLSSGKWYMGSVEAANEITKKTTDSDAASAPYAVGVNYVLVVRKNVEYKSPQQLFFVATYYDTRRGMDVHAQDSKLLSCTSNAESEAAPVVVLDKPRAYPFSPLDGLGKLVINASMFRTGKQVDAANAKFWWYTEEGGVEHLIGSTVFDVFYLSGQNTAALEVDLEYVGIRLIRCKAEYYTGVTPSVPTSKAVIAETKLIRRFPASTYWRSNKISGERVRPTDKSIIREAEAGTNAGRIANPGKFWHFRWLHNTNKPGAVDTEVGHGVSLNIPVTYAGVQSATPGTLKLEVVEHGEYQVLTDKNGEPLTDKDGVVLTGF